MSKSLTLEEKVDKLMAIVTRIDNRTKKDRAKKKPLMTAEQDIKLDLKIKKLV